VIRRRVAEPLERSTTNECFPERFLPYMQLRKVAELKPQICGIGRANLRNWEPLQLRKVAELGNLLDSAILRN
jgi:hypothetical protein